MKLKIGDMEFEVEFNDSKTAQEIRKKLPISASVENRWGDEKITMCHGEALEIVGCI